MNIDVFRRQGMPIYDDGDISYTKKPPLELAFVSVEQFGAVTTFAHYVAGIDTGMFRPYKHGLIVGGVKQDGIFSPTDMIDIATIHAYVPFSPQTN